MEVGVHLYKLLDAKRIGNVISKTYAPPQPRLFWFCRGCSKLRRTMAIRRFMVGIAIMAVIAVGAYELGEQFLWRQFALIGFGIAILGTILGLKSLLGALVMRPYDLFVPDLTRASQQAGFEHFTIASHVSRTPARSD